VNPAVSGQETGNFHTKEPFVKVVSSARRAALLTRRLPLQFSRSRQLFSDNGAAIGYVGFSQFGNVGDDLIYASHEQTLRAQLIPLPTENERLLYAMSGRKHDVRAILMGGGTIFGRSEWRRRVMNAMQKFDAPVIATGVGVEDPEFAGRRNYHDFSELKKWADVFRDSPHLSVRGPRSQELLRRVGLDSTVVSDTALLLTPDTLDVQRPEKPILGVSFAAAGDEKDADYLRGIEASAAAMKQLAQHGWAIAMFVFDRRDMPLTQTMATRIGGDVHIIPTSDDVTKLLPRIEACEVFVGQRLHSVVMASACGVPSIALEYQPKARDFQLSIDREEWVISTSEVTSARLFSLVQELAEHRSSHSDAIRLAVLQAKRVLLEDQQKIAGLLNLPAGEWKHVHR
jgi:polysaccharide pyruvyl transferase WcaK-like protein